MTSATVYLHPDLCWIEAAAVFLVDACLLSSDVVVCCVLRSRVSECPSVQWLLFAKQRTSICQHDPNAVHAC